jgi:hypothetical protein
MELAEWFPRDPSSLKDQGSSSYGVGWIRAVMGNSTRKKFGSDGWMGPLGPSTLHPLVPIPGIRELYPDTATP